MTVLVEQVQGTVTIVSVPAVDVDVEMYDTLRSLTLFPRGEMWRAFVACATKPRVWEGVVFVAYIDDQVVGWALRWKLSSNRRWNVFLFVAEPFRRRRVGTTLVAAAQRRIRSSVKGHPWDDTSRSFWATART